MSCSNCERKKAHALLIPFPAQGHITPMMRLAWKLVSDGFLITFLNTDVNHQRIIKANKHKTLQDEYSDKIKMISVPGGLPLNVSRGENTEHAAEIFFRGVESWFGPSVIDKVVHEINEKEEEQKVSCIIADVWTCLGLQTVAQLHHISLVAFNTSLVSTFAIQYSYPKFVSLGLLPSDGIPKEDTIQNYLSSVPPLNSSHLPWIAGGEYLFKHMIRMGKEAAKVEWMLFNTFYELEPDVIDDLSKRVGVCPIGPLISPEVLDGDRTLSTMATPSIWEADMECLEWLEKQSEQSVIYVSFGSQTMLSNRQVEELRLGLEATQRPFMWVVPSALMDGATAVFDRVGERGCIVSWAPQWRVLSHPSIACFVTHCGWNSVQESIIMGVPTLCWPHFADQFINRAYIVHVWKVGLPLELNVDGLVEKEEFRRAIETLIAAEEGKEIRAQIEKWNNIAKNTAKEGGLSCSNFELFVRAMMK